VEEVPLGRPVFLKEPLNQGSVVQSGTSTGQPPLLPTKGPGEAVYSKNILCVSFFEKR
jgi:hypothetical protein